MLSNRFISGIARRLFCNGLSKRFFKSKYFRNRRLPIVFHSLVFYSTHEYWPDLTNPTTFNEKIYSRLLFDVNPLYPIICNKYLSKFYIQSKSISGLEFPICYGIYQKLCPNDFDDFPDSFVIKLCHGSGHNLIVKDKNIVNSSDIASYFNNYVGTNRNAQFYTNPYDAILVEELIYSSNGLAPVDFKFHCFNNRISNHFDFLLQIDLDRFGEHKRIFLNSDLAITNIEFADAKLYAKSIELPDNILKMISIAKSLSHDFEYVRVDLYSENGLIYFGELTPFHQAGRAKLTSFDQDYMLGSMWEKTRLNRTYQFFY